MKLPHHSIDVDRRSIDDSHQSTLTFHGSSLPAAPAPTPRRSHSPFVAMSRRSGGGDSPVLPITAAALKGHSGATPTKRSLSDRDVGAAKGVMLLLVALGILWGGSSMIQFSGLQDAGAGALSASTPASSAELTEAGSSHASSRKDIEDLKSAIAEILHESAEEMKKDIMEETMHFHEMRTESERKVLEEWTHSMEKLWEESMQKRLESLKLPQSVPEPLLPAPGAEKEGLLAEKANIKIGGGDDVLRERIDAILPHEDLPTVEVPSGEDPKAVPEDAPGKDSNGSRPLSISTNFKGDDAQRILEYAESSQRRQPLTGDHRFVFIRIQKTGSKTVYDLFKRSGGFLPGSLLKGCKPNTNWVMGPKLTPKHCERGGQLWLSKAPTNSCFMNHHCGFEPMNVGFSRAVKAGPKPLWYMVQIRNPISRTISEYRSQCHTASLGNGGAWDYVIETDAQKLKQLAEHCQEAGTFLQFMKNPMHAMGMRNRQAKMIGSPGTCGNNADECLLASAKKALTEDIQSLWIMERFTTSAFVMAKLLGTKPPQKYNYIAEKHEMMEPPALSDDDLKEVAAHNAVDMKIYEFGLELLRVRAEALFGGFVEEQGCSYICKQSKEEFRERIMGLKGDQAKGVGSSCELSQECINRFF
jgi:hypothetical protein